MLRTNVTMDVAVRVAFRRLRFRNRPLLSSLGVIAATQREEPLNFVIVAKYLYFDEIICQNKSKAGPSESLMKSTGSGNPNWCTM